MWVVFFILVSILIFGVILVLPIKVRGIAHINGVKKQGFFSLKMWFINLAVGKIMIDENYKFAIDSDISNLMKSDESTKEKTMFVSHLVDKLKLSNFELFVDGGDKDNAFATAMTIGMFYSLGVSLLAVLDRKNKMIKPMIKISPDYTKDIFVLSGKFVIYISLVDVIISKLQSI